MASNLYDLLGVPRDATVEEIKKAYKKAALQHHPDKGGDQEKFKECSAALETLTDDAKRAAYDCSIIRSGSRDGMRGNYGDREASAERSSSASRPSYSRASSIPKATSQSGSSSSSRPPRPPAGPVEIPPDPSSLPVKELKELLTALGVNFDGCTEKAELLDLLQNRKSSKSGSSEATPGSDANSVPRQRGNFTDTKPPTDATKAQAKGAPRKVRVKVMSVGSAGTGKSCLIKHFCEGRFVNKYITTIGVDYGVKPTQVLGQNVKVNFFDTSGGAEYKEIRVEFFENTSGAILVFDVTNRQSFLDLEDWLEEAKRHKCPLSCQHKGSDAPPFVVLCANKTDLPRRTVSKAEGMQFASQHGMSYFETSAQSGESVEQAFSTLFEKVVGYQLEERNKLLGGC